MQNTKVLYRSVLMLLAFAVASAVNAQVIVIEPGHTATKMVDSVTPLHPSQLLLNTTPPAGGGIESIGVNPRTGLLYVQVAAPFGSYQSTTTNIFNVTPAGVVSVVAANTGFGINGRGTDLRWHPTYGLITQDQNSNRVAAINPATGAISTFAPFTFTAIGTFGVDVSQGAGGSDVPAGQILFTSDTGSNGIWSSPAGGPVVNHLTPPVPGDDIVIQQNGTWVHVPDFSGIMTAYNPAPPHVATPSPTGLNIAGLFLGAGRPFVHGSRATVCPATGEIYVSYSGSPGGSAIFRVNAGLVLSVHMADINWPAGLQDLMLGPSTGLGNSVYLTVNEQSTGTKQVWELSAPECPGGRVLIDIKPWSDPNSINTKNKGVVPVAVLGSATFTVSWIDVSTVRFGPAGTPPVHAAYEDVNLDGYMDLILQFDQQLTGLAAGDTQACVSGSLIIGGPFMGCDAVRIVK